MDTNENTTSLAEVSIKVPKSLFISTVEIDDYFSFIYWQ